MFAGFGTAEDTNVRFKEILRNGRHRPVHRLRHAHAHGPRLRQRRGRSARSAGPASPSTPSPTWRTCSPTSTCRRVSDVHDHQRAGAHRHGHVRRRRREDRGRAGGPGRHDPERHPQGVPGPEGVHLPAAPVGAAGHRPDALHRRRDAAVAPGVGVGLPHPRGGLDRRAGARLHARQRVRLRGGRGRRRARRRRLRPPPVVLLQRPHRLLRGDRQVPRRSPHLGPVDEGALRGAGPEEPHAAVPHPDRRRVAHRPAARRSTSPGSPCRPCRRRSAAPSRCTPTPTTRPWPCPPRRRPASRCAPSRSSPTRPASPTSPIRSAGSATSSG